MNASVVSLVTTDAEFPARMDPILMTSSSQAVYLLGGHMASCTGAMCGEVFTDVWVSNDVGITWQCQTANYDSTLTSSYTKGIGRHVGAVMTYDDTMFLIAGAKANFTVGLNSIWTSYAYAPDNIVPTDYPSLSVPAASGTMVL